MCSLLHINYTSALCDDFSRQVHGKRLGFWTRGTRSRQSMIALSASLTLALTHSRYVTVCNRNYSVMMFVSFPLMFLYKSLYSFPLALRSILRSFIHAPSLSPSLFLSHTFCLTRSASRDSTCVPIRSLLPRQLSESPYLARKKILSLSEHVLVHPTLYRVPALCAARHLGHARRRVSYHFLWRMAPELVNLYL